MPEDQSSAAPGEEAVPVMVPNMDLAQALFTVQAAASSAEEKQEAKTLLEVEITAGNMAPFYKLVCEELKWSVDEAKLKQMEEDNSKEIEKLDNKVKDADENLGEIEQRDAHMEKAEYLVKIGNKEAALTALRQSYEKTTMLGHKLDNVFLQLRVGFFFLDNDVISRNLEKASSLIDEGGDWDRRNRLKVYAGYYALIVRDFKLATEKFLDSISTFTCYELMSYPKFVNCTVLASMITLKRADIGTKIINGSEILENLHQLPETSRYLHSLYECQYADFFKALASVEGQLQQDRVLAVHCSYYVREMKIRAYAQLLESYRALTLTYMANAFGVTEEYIDRELSRFISAGRLNCKIDKVGGVVETNRPDSKNAQYQAVIKQGDILLNRIQKLSRVINL